MTNNTLHSYKHFTRADKTLIILISHHACICCDIEALCSCLCRVRWQKIQRFLYQRYDILDRIQPIFKVQTEMINLITMEILDSSGSLQSIRSFSQRGNLEISLTHHEALDCSGWTITRGEEGQVHSFGLIKHISFRMSTLLILGLYFGKAATRIYGSINWNIFKKNEGPFFTASHWWYIYCFAICFNVSSFSSTIFCN